MSAPTFSTPATAPQRGSDTFSSEVATFLSYISTLGATELPTFVTWLQQQIALTEAAKGAGLWVTGTAYTTGAYAVSPSDLQLYRATSDMGSSTTDPASDAANWDAVAVAISAGGTGAGTAAGARTSLGLEIGVDVQAYDAILAAVSAGALSYRNKIINGNFGVNQRVASGTVTLSAGDYGHDRWKAGASGCTYTFATSANVTTITISAGSLVQVIEGTNLQSGTHVLSWTGTVQMKIDAGSAGASGMTATLTGGTNASVETSGTGTLSLVQLEQGSVATPFEHKPYSEEELRCLQYYQRIRGAAGDVLASAGGSFGTTRADFAGHYIVPMRDGPSLTYDNLVVSNIGNSDAAISAASLVNSTSRAFRISCTSTGLSGGVPYLLRVASGSTGYIAFDAEL